MTNDQPPNSRRRGRVSEELIASFSKESDIMQSEGAVREELSHYAAQSLLNHGINPTVALVRRITNLGSNDAIARDIEKWRAGIGDVLKQRSLKTEVPDGVITMVETMVNGLWRGALIEANQKYDVERQGVYLERDTAVDAERLAKGLLEASQSEIQRLQTEVASKDEAIKSAESRCAAFDASIQELTRSMKHLQEELDRERHERQKERERAAEDLQNTHKSHEAALAVVEGNRKYALLQLDAARTNERTLAERVKNLEAELHLRDTQNRQVISSLRDQNSQVLMESGVLRGTLKAREEELQRSIVRITELESRLQLEAEKKTQAAQDELEEARRQACLTLATAAKNNPSVFEFCDLRECHVVVEFSDNNVPAYTLRLDADGTKISIPGTDLQSVIDFCKRHTD